MEKKTWLVDFEPVGKRIEVEEGLSILDAARQTGIKLIAICGGVGTCGQCKVQLKSGNVGCQTTIDKGFFTEEQISNGWSLACQSIINQPIKVFIPPESLSTQQRLQVESSLDKLLPKSIFSIEEILLDKKGLSAYEDSKIINKYFPYSTKKKDGKNQNEFYGFLNKALKSKKEKLQIIKKNGKPIDYFFDIKTVYGLAVDLGTTKIAAFLVDLITGLTVAKTSAMNPQISYGEDVISRILYCIEKPMGSTVMKNIIIDTLNNLCCQMCEEIGVLANQVLETVIVGNTPMHHLVIGLPVKQLGLSPYNPAETKSLYLQADDLGLNISPRGRVYFPENISGYVGGDHVAMMVATDAYKAQDHVIAIDIGTNTEISLVSKGKIFTCSCASGPAFEGAHIKDGMRAADGAIERVKIIDNEVQYQTIGSVIPIGLCGSGILDAIAELKKNRIIDERGRFNANSKNIRGIGKEQEFVLVQAEKTGTKNDIVITRKDVNEILLAKAAIQSGIQILLKTANLSTFEINRIIVAGAFGSYLDIDNAMEIGLFPKLPIDRFKQVGNAAGSGAKQMVISDQIRKKAKKFAELSEYVELTQFSDFQKIYINSLKFAEFPNLS